MEMCPLHPWQELETCPACEALIAERESLELEENPGESDRQADRYQRWLDGLGG